VRVGKRRALRQTLGRLYPVNTRFQKPVTGARRQITGGILEGLCIESKTRSVIQVQVFSRALTVGVALLLCTSGGRAAGTPIPHGTLELIAEKQWIATGQKVYLGLRFQLEKGWHIYWVNPGDSGEPPRVKWQLPTGLTAGEMEWPAPRRLGTSTIVDFGYEGAVMLIVPMNADASLAAQGPARLAAEVKVLVCREMCIPSTAQLSLTLPIKSQLPAPDARTIDFFTATRRSLPRPVPENWRIRVADANDSFVLTANLGQQTTEAIFFPLAESQIENAAPQNLLPVARGFRLMLRKSDQLQKPIDRLKGVLVLSADRAYLIDVPLSKLEATRNSSGVGIQPAHSLKEGPRR
jgi:DsbC/DsbD-like thiol-disulfide interchange protein